MIQIILVGIAAGATAAVLFLSVISGSALALPLAYLAPLPILIATLGWSSIAGVVAMVSAAVLLFVTLGGLLFLGFLIGTAFPAWWLGYLAMLPRPVPDADPPRLDWYPVGSLVIWAAVLAAAVIVISALSFGGDAETYRAHLAKLIERAIQFQQGAGRDRPLQLPAGVDPKALAEILVTVAPLAFAALLTCNNVFFLWLAARIVRVSGRLRRSWPDLPSMTFPKTASVFLASTVLIAMLPLFTERGTPVLGALGSLVPDPVSLAARVLAVALVTAHALLGLAALHSLTRPLSNGRGLILAATYTAIFVIGWPILLMALLGLADSALDLRLRLAARHGRPPT